MNDRQLLKLSLIISLIGTFILLIMLEYQEIPIYKTTDISKSQIDTRVRVHGKVDSIRETPGLYIINLKDEKGKITAVVFKEEQINLTKNSNVEIEGKVQEYKNSLEIIVDRIYLME